MFVDNHYDITLMNRLVPCPVFSIRI